MPEPRLVGSIILELGLDPQLPHHKFERAWMSRSDELGISYPLPPGWQSLIKELSNAGVTDEAFAEAIDEAMVPEADSQFGHFRATIHECRKALVRDGGQDVPPRVLVWTMADPGIPSRLVNMKKAQDFEQARRAESDRMYWVRMDEEARRNRAGRAEAKRLEQLKAEKAEADQAARRGREAWLAANGPLVIHRRTRVYHFTDCLKIRDSRWLDKAYLKPDPEDFTCGPCRTRARAELPSTAALAPVREDAGEQEAAGSEQ